MSSGLGARQMGIGESGSKVVSPASDAIDGVAGGTLAEDSLTFSRSASAICSWTRSASSSEPVAESVCSSVSFGEMISSSCTLCSGSESSTSSGDVATIKCSSASPRTCCVDSLSSTACMVCSVAVEMSSNVWDSSRASVVAS